MKNKKRWLPGLAAVAASLAALYSLVHWVDRDERVYYHRGRLIVEALDEMARGLEKRDLSVLQGLYAEDFRDKALGLQSPSLAGETDGVRAYTFLAGTSPAGREEALQEWRSYLEAFQSIEGIRLHMVDFQQWGEASDLRAGVGYQARGRLGDPEGPVADRALLTMHFRLQPGGSIAISGARLIKGERLIGGAPLWRDVAAESGLARSRASQAEDGSRNDGEASLKYPLARFWGAGVAAADYDQDGWVDLLAPSPEGVRLLRNTGQGGFQDGTALAGISGAGEVRLGLLADYDNDGRRDLFVGRAQGGNRLYHANEDGTFADVTGRVGIAVDDCCTTSAAWADYDNDGDLDLYVGRHLDPSRHWPQSIFSRNGLANRLYRNNGDGTFRETAQAAGTAGRGLTLAVAWGDYDRDGYADLLVSNEYGRSRMLRNNGDGTFADAQAPGTLGFGSAYSAVFVDYNEDQRLDVFTGRVHSHESWYGEGPTVAAFILNTLRQRGVSEAGGIFYRLAAQAGEGALGVYSPRLSGRVLLAATPSRDGAPRRFTDATWDAELEQPAWIWGASFADFDNDGDLDAYLATGFLTRRPDSEMELDFLHAVVHQQDAFSSGSLFQPSRWGERSWFGGLADQIARNNGDGTFTEVSFPSGLSAASDSRGTASADFFRRGRPDIAVSTAQGRIRLLRNERQADGGNWLVLRLRGSESNRDAVGARVAVTTDDGRVREREVALGSGFASQNSFWLHFGLGQAQKIEEARVFWPATGRQQILDAIPLNAHVHITEGADQASEF